MDNVITGSLRMILCLCIMVFVLEVAHSQSIGNIDLTTVNIKSLSDEQIQQYLDALDERGISQENAELLAKQKGVSQRQIQELRRRIDTYRSGVSISSAPSVQSSMETSRNIVSVSSNKMPLSKSTQDTGFFGANVFGSGNLTFAPNLSLPTPVDYVLGPGDELLIGLWGASQRNLRLIVSPDGNVKPENIGPVYVNGLSIDQATVKLIDKLSQIYSGLKSTKDKEANIFYQVSLGQIRTISVEIIGDVKLPGTYSLPSLATVYTALHSAGGPNVNGSFREVRLIRDNKLLVEIDVYDYLLKGMKTNNLILRSGDVLLIPGFEARVSVQGELRRPGSYELTSDETLDDIIRFAGGFNDQAYEKTVTVKRNGEVERLIFDLDKGKFGEFHPQDGDLIEVGRILQRYENRVVISGAVEREGEFEFTEGLTLIELIEKANGLRGDAFRNRAIILRTNVDFSQVTIPIDLTSLEKGSDGDIHLQREDLVTIKSVYDLKEEFYLKISGEVLEPGIYPFFSQMTVEDLVVLSGGLKESTSGALIEIARRNKAGSTNTSAKIITLSMDQDLSLSSGGHESLLQPFDEIYVRKSPGYALQQQVVIEGEVLVPGEYAIQKKDERISDILKRSSGLTPYSYPKGAILIRKTEFYLPESSRRVGQERLSSMRARILADQSELKSQSQRDLLERLEVIERRSAGNADMDVAGSKVKMSLFEDATGQDSLMRDVQIGPSEPVAIDLELILKTPGSKYDLIVKPGDIISVPGKLQTVRVAGEVTSSLNIRYDESYRFKDYIDQSGGFLQTAKRSRSYVQYPNGERKGVKRFLWFRKYPKIEPGATIFVSRKPERSPVNFQAIIAAAGSVATFALVIDRLSN